MAPTLKDGDCLLTRRTQRVRAGDVVVARFRSRPDLLVVKRATTAYDGGWLLSSDNALAPPGPTGVADVEAKVLLRYLPWPPRRPGSAPAL